MVFFMYIKILIVHCVLLLLFCNQDGKYHKYIGVCILQNYFDVLLFDVIILVFSSGCLTWV